MYWRRIRDISDRKYHIKLNAVAHDAYVTMFNYLRCATAKKPIHEIDPTPYFSPEHPQGEDLKSLLAVGAQYVEVRAARQKPTVPVDPVIRSQFGIFFNWVVDRELRGAKGAVQVKSDAVAELKAGRSKLLDFVKKHRASLLDQVDFCWELVDAKSHLERLGKSRVEILIEAAAGACGSCANGDGRCASAYEGVLGYQRVSSAGFRHSLFETVRHGRRKGNAFMIVGGADTGKTTLTEPLSKIFKTMATPQADTFCPLQDARGHELFLWQDFRYSPGHPRKEEQGLRLDEGTWNRLLEGLPTLVGVAKTDGSRGDFVYKDDAPFVCTGPFALQAYKNGYADPKETEQLACRMKYVVFGRAAPPPEQLSREFRPCAFCWSQWLLRGECEWRASCGQAADDFMEQVGRVLPAPDGHTQLPSAPAAAASEPVLAVPGGVAHAPGATGVAAPGFFEQLSQLMMWRDQGKLSDREFAAAKVRLGLV